MNRIGDQLVADGCIDQAQLQQALDRQRAVGGYLGQHLLELGFITRADLYEALARQWEVTTRDLDRDPPQPGLASIVDLERTIELGWVACELSESGEVIVATSVRPGPDLFEEVQEHFPGASVEFVACTQRDLDHVAVRARRDLTPSRTPLPAPVRTRSAAVSLLGVAVVLAALLASTILTPLGVLAAVLAGGGVLFLLAVVLQCGAAVRLATRDVAERREAAAFSEVVRASEAKEAPRDALLPVYSVLVPLAGSTEVVQRVVRQLDSIDYPTSRLDAILLVSEDDADTLAAVKAAAPPAWVRVLSVSAQRFPDPALACDEGLASARGRYVVAYADDEEPEPDQLRWAVELFEADLQENLERQPDRAPLAGLRTRDRVWGRDSSLATGGEVVAVALGLDRAYPWRGEFTQLERDVFSTHFNTHVLRRSGGWQAYVAGPGGSPGHGAEPRMATLRSTSRRVVVPGLWSTVRRHAHAAAPAQRMAATRARAWLMGWDFDGRRPTFRQALVGLGTPLLFLAYPVLLAAAAAYLVRWSATRDDTLPVGGTGVAAIGLAVVVAVIVAGVLATWQQARRASLHAVLLPAHWLVRAAAAWYAVLVLPHPSGRARQAASGTDPGITVGSQEQVSLHAR